MEENNSVKISRKEWLWLGGLCALGLFYYVLLRWVILERFCAPETVALLTKVHASAKFSLMHVLIGFLTLATVIAFVFLREFLKRKKEDKK